MRVGKCGGGKEGEAGCEAGESIGRKGRLCE